MSLLFMKNVKGLTHAIDCRAVISIESCRAGKVDGLDEKVTLVRYDIGEGIKFFHAQDDLKLVHEKLLRQRPEVATWFTFKLWEEGQFQPVDALNENVETDLLITDPRRIQAVEGLDPTHEDNSGAQCLITVDYGIRGEKGPKFVRHGLMMSQDKVTASLETL